MRPLFLPGPSLSIRSVCPCPDPLPGVFRVQETVFIPVPISISPSVVFGLWSVVSDRGLELMGVMQVGYGRSRFGWGCLRDQEAQEIVLLSSASSGSLSAGSGRTRPTAVPGLSGYADDVFRLRMSFPFLLSLADGDGTVQYCTCTVGEGLVVLSSSLVGADPTFSSGGGYALSSPLAALAGVHRRLPEMRPRRRGGFRAAPPGR